MDNSIGIGDIVTILTAAGVTIYVLGLIGLAIPISRTFTNDLSTAWYAVSLLPRTIVAGQGVRIWLRFPLLLVLVFVPFMLVARWEHRRDPLPLPGDFTTVLILVVFSFSAPVVIALLVGRIRMGWPWGKLVFYTFFIAAGGAFIQVPLQWRPDMQLTYAIPLIFAGSFLAGIPTATRANPPLPNVAVTKQARDTMEEGFNPTNVAGHLVAHSDGFWHLFDRNNNDLLSIPDSEVLEVRTFRHPYLTREQRHKRNEDMRAGEKKAK